MDLKFKVAIRVARPVHEVFEAVADPDQLSHYFTTGGAKGRLETGATVMWDFHDFPGAFPVEVVEVVPDARIVLRWAANDKSASTPYQTQVEMSFEGLDDGRTLVSISEHGWHETPSGLATSYGNCMGWTQMICALKAWMEHGVNLREGAFK
ncbi:SRPBCC domain-containing protein [Sphingobium nicotianae]|uniref:SRPBCC domain-containing protein n=1 Tax=Sphingobium nicotianae TaxID=2782607 RepID=A0A9X1IT34_9SPHN|nr:SRPBCC domain-containing protein [Sphingobium nicotianae]MBT2189163.1 SRPBCC domain-containing protein [Sphingobium nicotianae]